MKYLLFASIASLGWSVFTVALSAPPPAQYKPEDVVKSFAPSTAPSQASDCENGEPRDESGACPVLDDSGGSRGFSLVGEVPPGAKGHAPADHVQSPGSSARHRAAPSAGASIHAPAPAGHRDMLITFKVGSSQLTDQAQSNALVFAKALGTPELASLKFTIEGHTDSSGSPEANTILSKARAEAVVAFLVAHGVDPSRLQAVGYGSSRPLDGVDAKSPSNRRVEARKLN